MSFSKYHFLHYYQINVFANYFPEMERILEVESY